MSHNYGGVNVDFRFCCATYLITTFFWENIFSKCLMFLEDHVKAFRTHVVRASNSSWARRYPPSKIDEFRGNRGSESLCNSHIIPYWRSAVWAIKKNDDFCSPNQIHPWSLVFYQRTCLVFLCVVKYLKVWFCYWFWFFSSVWSPAGVS